MGPDMNELEVEQIEERLRKSAVGHRPAVPSELLRFVDAVPVENRFAGRPTLIGHPHVRRSFAALATAAAVVVGLVGGVALVSLRTGGTAVSGGPDAAGWAWQRGDGTSVFQIGRVANGYLGRCADGLCSSRDGVNWTSPADPRIVVIEGAGSFIPQDILHLGSVYVAISIGTGLVAPSGDSSQAAPATQGRPTPTAPPTQAPPAAESPVVDSGLPADSLWRSADGLHWRRVDSLALGGLSPTAVGRIPGGFGLAAVASQDQPGWLLTSSDGITWTKSSRMPVVATITTGGSSVDGLWVSGTGGRESGVWWATLDGATWAQMIMPAGVAQLDAAFTLGGEHVGMVVGPSVSGIVRSVDGVTWKADRGDLPTPAVTLCRIGERLVTANLEEEVWQSDDGGLTWRPMLDPFGNQLVGTIQSAGGKLSVYSFTTNPADNTGTFHLDWLVSYGGAST